jgi:hypothetical protein
MHIRRNSRHLTHWIKGTEIEALRAATEENDGGKKKQ